jgi:hypothetical protein
MLEHFEGFSLAGHGASSQRIVGRGGAMCFFNWRNIAITLIVLRGEVLSEIPVSVNNHLIHGENR